MNPYAILSVSGLRFFLTGSHGLLFTCNHDWSTQIRWRNPVGWGHDTHDTPSDKCDLACVCICKIRHPTVQGVIAHVGMSLKRLHHTPHPILHSNPRSTMWNQGKGVLCQEGHLLHAFRVAFANFLICNNTAFLIFFDLISKSQRSQHSQGANSSQGKRKVRDQVTKERKWSNRECAVFRSTFWTFCVPQLCEHRNRTDERGRTKTPKSPFEASQRLKGYKGQR